MDQLRLILFGVGVIIIAFIYLWGMRKQIRDRLEERRRRRAALRAENQPTVYFDEPEPQPQPLPKTETSAHEPAVASHYQQPASEAETPQNDYAPITNDDIASEEDTPLTVLLTIMAPPEHSFSGIEILHAAHETNLKLNKNGTLDFLSETDQGRQLVFRIGHLKEPGNFELTRIKDLSTPGLLLFLELPGPLPASKAVDRMTAIAAHLAKMLGGTVCDERRNKLSTETLTALRERALEFERRLSL